ncbi:DUF4328 domain-containing protein [Streptomyces sp. NPDC051104]|uniref:DUF4328 domain-containing protein n=1 Tax=Streptomyces sp. NPDC051104 TaxID=3155044 RepID=UPI00342049C9
MVFVYAMTAAAVLLLVWPGRCRRNAQSLTGTSVGTSGVWAVVAWFIPVINWWFPRQFVLDIERASAGASQKASNAALVNAWWASRPTRTPAPRRSTSTTTSATCCRPPTRGQTLSYAYDVLDGKTAESSGAWSATPDTSKELASFSYDTLAKGHPTSSTRYVGGAGGDACPQAITDYTTDYQPTGAATSVPTSTGFPSNGTGSNSNTYTVKYSYTEWPGAGLPPVAAARMMADADSLGGQRKGCPPRLEGGRGISRPSRRGPPVHDPRRAGAPPPHRGPCAGSNGRS